ncbi:MULTISPECIES: DUF4178 domain-containing protein [unclassified Paenibacillus]|uniref:DUF4178 domain-containing protein n=1 Tax=unclassified Paenibacillus TaxID=185978 RepID=UPI001C10B8F6|nr:MULTISPECIES: DUF4178 domain-containing protein [unclassified Paenibacillus]MBU5443210.1 DUF4178 domain-containing protein [Paenibacillus sp. MSJ-34]CAH0121390.1 hypothetical protein PAE9249_03918 [Paenibacillus sp. CECT 9249]
MSLLKRIKNIISKPEPPKPEKTVLQLGPGDIVDVSLVTYQVVGRTHNRQRNAVVLTLADGNTIRYLHIEERERTVYALYEPIDGRLDTPDEVPTTIEMEDHTYYMEERYSGMVTAAGKTPFMHGGEQYVWQYQSDDYKLLRIEWQDGRFMLYEGESVLPADVQVTRGS